jgi:hypothetical protein
MDKQPEEKRAKENGLKHKLESGLHVQNHQLKKWLGDDAFKQMEDDWKTQQSLRDDLSDSVAYYATESKIPSTARWLY